MPAALPKIKFCGITSLDDAQIAVAADAWAIGLIFWPGSPRRCHPDVATEIAAVFRRRVEIVGVFVNPTLDYVGRIADDVGLTMLQLHGDEGPVFCGEAARRTGCTVTKAARVKARSDIQALTAFHTDYHLLDGYVHGLPGGTGQPFEWQLVRAYQGSSRVILSGGLTPANVAGAIHAVGPFAVDVASGVEASPGRKDPAKIEAFAAAVAATAAPDPEPEVVT